MMSSTSGIHTGAWLRETQQCHHHWLSPSPTAVTGSKWDYGDLSGTAPSPVPGTAQLGTARHGTGGAVRGRVSQWKEPHQG